MNFFSNASLFRKFKNLIVDPLGVDVDSNGLSDNWTLSTGTFAGTLSYSIISGYQWFILTPYAAAAKTRDATGTLNETIPVYGTTHKCCYSWAHTYASKITLAQILFGTCVGTVPPIRATLYNVTDSAQLTFTDISGITSNTLFNFHFTETQLVAGKTYEIRLSSADGTGDINNKAIVAHYTPSSIVGEFKYSTDGANYSFTVTDADMAIKLWEKIQTVGGGYIDLYTPTIVGVQPNVNYLIGAVMFRVSASGYCRLQVSWYNDSMNLLSSDVGVILNTSSSTYKQDIFTCPNSANKAVCSILFYESGNTTDSSLRMKDIKFGKVV